jgi:hypothetical protein
LAGLVPPLLPRGRGLTKSGDFFRRLDHHLQMVVVR